MLYVKASGKPLQVIVKLIPEIKFYMPRHNHNGLAHKESKCATHQAKHDDYGAKQEQADKELDKEIVLDFCAGVQIEQTDKARYAVNNDADHHGNGNRERCRGCSAKQARYEELFVLPEEVIEPRQWFHVPVSD